MSPINRNVLCASRLDLAQSGALFAGLLNPMTYYIAKTVAGDFDAVLQRTVEALKAEGFGVLTEIHVDRVLKAKLDVDFRRYSILGACNPAFAHQALQAEDRVGLMLPCNVLVQDRGQGQVEVAAIDPAAAMASVGNPALETLAGAVRDRLQ